MRKLLVTLTGSTGDQSSYPWYVSTRRLVEPLSWQRTVPITLQEDDWVDFWSYAGIQPAAINWQGDTVEVIAPKKPTWGDTLKLLHVTDLHLERKRRGGPILGREEFGDKYAPLEVEVMVRELMESASAETPIDLLVFTGDLTDHGTVEEFSTATNLMDRLGVPSVLVPGNHDHYGSLYEQGEAASIDVMAVADTSRFERCVGPRWWARLLGDGIIVGLDWFSWRLGLDTSEQLLWLRTLAGTFGAPRRIVMAAHDEFAGPDWNSITEAISPHRVVVVMSGHWHISRVHGRREYMGFSTSSVGCGGLHLGPPESRLFTFSQDLSLKNSATFIAPGDAWVRSEGAQLQGQGSISATKGDVEWTTQIGCRLHQTNAVFAGGHFLVGGAFENRPGGRLVWLDEATGKTQRMIEIEEGAVGPIGSTVVDGRRICASCLVDGSVFGFDWDGTPLFHFKRQEPALRYSQAGAVISGTSLIVGDVRSIDCLDLSDGGLRWSLNSPGRPENLISYGRPLAVRDRVLIPLGGPGVGLVSVKISDGRVEWKEDGGRGIPASQLMVDNDCLYLLRSRGHLECLELSTGNVIWSTFLGVDLGAPAPLLVGESVVAVTTSGYGGVFEKATGQLLEVFRVPLVSTKLGPYRTCSAFVTCSGVREGRVSVACARTSVWVQAAQGCWSEWKCSLDLGILSTSGPQLGPRGSVILGFSGQIALIKSASGFLGAG